MNEQTLIDDLQSLLAQGVSANQGVICTLLHEKGHDVSQPKISRLLKKLNAVKIKNEEGEMVYCLPHDIAPPSIDMTLSELIIDIIHNETTIIIQTSPGSASVIARILDHKKCDIIGTIAGDDTIFIAPTSIKTIEKTMQLIGAFLGFSRLRHSL